MIKIVLRIGMIIGTCLSIIGLIYMFSIDSTNKCYSNCIKDNCEIYQNTDEKGTFVKTKGECYCTKNNSDGSEYHYCDEYKTETNVHLNYVAMFISGIVMIEVLCLANFYCVDNIPIKKAKLEQKYEVMNPIINDNL